METVTNAMNTTTTTIAATNTTTTPRNPQNNNCLYRFTTQTAAMRHAINPAYFAQSVLAFEPDQTQKKILEINPHRLILNCNRQWGKSTVSAILLAHRAIFSTASLSIIVSASERQSAETLRKVANFLHLAGVRSTSDKVNRRSLLLPQNNSRIIALPSSDTTVRGFSKVSLLLIDEASRVPDPLYYALRPALAVSQGDIVMVSTPFGKRGFFYTEFTNASAAQSPVHNWIRVTVPASQCPRIPAAFLDQERALGEEYFAQEYECQFVEDGRFLFSDADCQRLFKTDLEPLRIHDRRGPAWQNVMQPAFVTGRTGATPTSPIPGQWPNIYSREE